MTKPSDRQVDPAERWLRQHDPQYEQSSVAWRVSRTDALDDRRTGQATLPQWQEGLESIDRPSRAGAFQLPGNFRRKATKVRDE